MGPFTRKLGMQSELHINNVYQSVELLLLVPMYFLMAIPKCLLIFKENVYYASIIIIHAYSSSTIEFIAYTMNVINIYEDHTGTHHHNNGWMGAHTKQFSKAQGET